MAARKLTLDEQIKTAEIVRLLAESEKAKSEKLKLDLECADLRKEGKKPWLLKKEFWAVLMTLIIAGAAVITYIFPLSEIHNVQVARINEFKTDSLIKAKKQLDSAKLRINDEERNLSKANIINRTLKSKVDSFSVVLNESINSETKTNKQLIGLKDQTVKLQNYLNLYNHSQKTLLNKASLTLFDNESKEDNSILVSTKDAKSDNLQYSASIVNDRVIIMDLLENKIIGWLPRADWQYRWLAFSKNSKMLYIGTGENQILSFELPTTNLADQFQLQSPLRSDIKRISVDANGSTFILYTSDGDITKWDKSGRLISVVKTNDKSKYENE